MNQTRGVALAWASLISGLLSTTVTGYLQLVFAALATLCQLASITCLLASNG